MVMVGVSALVTRFSSSNKFAIITTSVTAAFTGYVVTVLPALPNEITDAIELNALVVAFVAGLITFFSLRTKNSTDVDVGTKQKKITGAAPK
jgi:ABC-type transport system involved in cytochrome c biogenesis permease subunit